MPTIAFSQGFNDSYSKAKKYLERNVYNIQEMRKTIYCNAVFNAQKIVELPSGIIIEKYKNKANKIEWEHVVPAENFGRAFIEWREGHPSCINNKGNAFKGRSCAEKVNMEYRYMQSDMYNLYPAIGSVNALRSNYDFVPMENVVSTFGTCEMTIIDKKASPPVVARGKIARAYLYMESEYARYRLSKSQKNLMQAWNNMYPVTADECYRTKQIELIQKNENTIVKNQCIDKGLW